FDTTGVGAGAVQRDHSGAEVRHGDDLGGSADGAVVGSINDGDGAAGGSCVIERALPRVAGERAQVQVPGGGNSPVVGEVVSGIVAAAHPGIDVGGCAGVHGEDQTERPAARRSAQNEGRPDVDGPAVYGDVS